MHAPFMQQALWKSALDLCMRPTPSMHARFGRGCVGMASVLSEAYANAHVLDDATVFDAAMAFVQARRVAHVSDIVRFRMADAFAAILPNLDAAGRGRLNVALQTHAGSHHEHVAFFFGATTVVGEGRSLVYQRPGSPGAPSSVARGASAAALSVDQLRAEAKQQAYSQQVFVKRSTPVSKADGGDGSSAEREMDSAAETLQGGASEYLARKRGKAAAKAGLSVEEHQQALDTAAGTLQGGAGVYLQQKRKVQLANDRILVSALGTDSGKAELKSLFESLDKDGDGRVTSKEWGGAVVKNQALLSRYFGGATAKEVGRQFQRVDVDGSGALTWDEFVSGCVSFGGAIKVADALLTDSGKAELKGLFESLDKNSDGRVTRKEWGGAMVKNQALLSRYFGGATAKEVEGQFQRVDVDGSGALTWDEFVSGVQTLGTISE